MIRILTLLGLAMIVCAIFAAIFLNGSGARCLPPSALGVTPSDNALILSFDKDGQAELAVLAALIAAAGKVSPAPSKSYKAKVTFADVPTADDTGGYCRTKVWDLAFEIGATILAALAVGIWIARRRNG